MNDAEFFPSSSFSKSPDPSHVTNDDPATITISRNPAKEISLFFLCALCVLCGEKALGFRTQHGIPRDKYFRTSVPREPISHLPIIVEIENREVRVFARFKAAFAILEIQSAGRIHRGRGNGFRRGHLH